MKPLFTHITLNTLELSVHLGWPDAERAVPQIVHLDVRLSFPAPPVGCMTDDLSDTHCYDTLISQIKANILPNSFRLLEHLGQQIYLTIASAMPADIHISVRVKKQTEIPHLTGGVTFYYGDENSAW